MMDKQMSVQFLPVTDEIQMMQVLHSEILLSILSLGVSKAICLLEKWSDGRRGGFSEGTDE
jgi:hypothetical protein